MSGRPAPHDDISVLGRWWWTIDRWVLSALIALLALGMVLTMAASPPAASRLGLDSFHFVRAQFTYLPLALLIMLGVSLLSPRAIRRLALIVFLVFFAMTALTPALGTEIKGARRWLELFGQSLQPSEFLKPSSSPGCSPNTGWGSCPPGRGSPPDSALP